MPEPATLKPGEDLPREIAFGAVGRFWAGETIWPDIDAADFTHFSAPGNATIGGHILVDPLDGGTRITYEARRSATDGSVPPRIPPLLALRFADGRCGDALDLIRHRPERRASQGRCLAPREGARMSKRLGLRLAAAAAAFATAAYGVYVCGTWLRYGRRRRPLGGQEADPLLDRFMPEYEVSEHRPT